jgi:hypothetical protein
MCLEGTRAAIPLGHASTYGDLLGFRHSGPLASGTEGVQTPDVLRFVMSQDKIIAVFRTDAKIDGSRGVPLILNFDDFENVAAQGKPEGALVGFISSMGFDAQIAHRSPQAGLRCPGLCS